MNTKSLECDDSKITSGLVSVVIPTYNHAHFLKQAIQSVVDQTYPCWEALVVDNHSKDNTDAVVASFSDPRVKLFKIHNEGVIAASRNLGIRNARGEWVAFLDSDDYWSPEKLKISLDYLQKSADIVYHDMWLIHQLGKTPWRKLRTWQVKTPVIVDLLVRGNTLPNSSVVVRRELLTKIEGLNQSKHIIASEDADAWLRIAELTDRFVRVPFCLGYYWLGGNNISKAKDMSIPTMMVHAHYEHYLKNKERRQAKSLLAYTAGRHQYNIGNYSEARDLMKIAIGSKRLLVVFKAIAMLSILFFQKKWFVVSSDNK